MYQTKAYAATSPTSGLAVTTIPRRDPGEHDVVIEILYCGICHSDLHHVRDEFQPMMPTLYPYVPGHEIIGRVSATGSAVSNHKVGDIVGIRSRAALRSAQHRRFELRQHRPNSRDARLLWPAQHHRRRRGHSHSKDQRGIRPAGEGRREVSLLHRYVLALNGVTFENADPAKVPDQST